MFCGHDKPHLRTNQLRAQVRVPNVEPCKTDWRQIGLKSMPSASSPLLSTSGSSSEALVYSGLGLGGLEVEASSSFGTENQLEPRFVLCVPFDLVCNSSKLPGCYLLASWSASKPAKAFRSRRVVRVREPGGSFRCRIQRQAAKGKCLPGHGRLELLASLLRRFSFPFEV